MAKVIPAMSAMCADRVHNGEMRHVFHPTATLSCFAKSPTLASQKFKRTQPLQPLGVQNIFAGYLSCESEEGGQDADCVP